MWLDPKIRMMMSPPAWPWCLRFKRLRTQAQSLYSLANQFRTFCHSRARAPPRSNRDTRATRNTSRPIRWMDQSSQRASMPDCTRMDPFIRRIHQVTFRPLLTMTTLFPGVAEGGDLTRCPKMTHCLLSLLERGSLASLGMGGRKVYTCGVCRRDGSCQDKTDRGRYLRICLWHLQ